jgi:hypothetical protein
MHLSKNAACGKVLVMVQVLRKKSLFLAVYVVFVAAGVFSFMQAELSSVSFEVRNAKSNAGSIITNNYFIQQPATTALTFKTSAARLIFLRMGFQRLAQLDTSPAVQNTFSKLSLTTNAKIQHINFKNTISLNLRI